MAKYVCSVCGFEYDEAIGIPEAGIAPGTKWEDLPEDWVCPVCGAEKSDFEMEGSVDSTPQIVEAAVAADPDMKELSPLEVSALCSNLARGCEKQYKFEEAELFSELAAFFKSKAVPAKDPDFSQLFELVEKDLEQGIPNANSAAEAVRDRGALRALVWNEKVTRILKSLLTRYQKEGDALFANTGVYVCTICGFIFIGDKLPDVCPICKVPNWKFEKVEGR
ncbi:MAG: rubredoxin [Bacillota bacterium]|jgi:rubredoxin|nr:rubredoxin [Bacillota bacterium]NLU55050.1 rubredoxin [Bacillota bacterium]HOA90717.1 rubredoxin [Bacillota bacterium]HPZ73126.1 rubredoxin [Bacillota bacterium]HQD77839.1 rubredoxin [Bacillota bacterium]